MLYYGVLEKQDIKDMAFAVCSAIGHGRHGRAVELLVETCAAETLLAQAKDTTPYYAGAGVAQVDEGTFDWLKDKYQSHKMARDIKRKLGVDLKLVSYNELDFSPLISLIFARLRYWTVADLIPATREGRAKYWKTHYNTSKGKGSPEEYLERCKASGVDELFIGEAK
ncbi:hypothetical protein [Vibrio europaeus]|uniref:hypothetical protein n=1 Tax=Vibrio europaeus TaxID=300876 RepID=UPI00233F54BC|nr:hypothetical protein [Vibrio europaeus]MDC5753609.1 hypothetical protein [Vibrio europaeus]MDC5816478.1 hypothetical protein [Vibrio europaeus]